MSGMGTITDSQCHAEAVERFVAAGSPDVACCNCSPVDGTAEERVAADRLASDDQPMCRPCYQAALEHGRRHIPEAFDDDDDDTDSCRSCGRALGSNDHCEECQHYGQ